MVACDSPSVGLSTDPGYTFVKSILAAQRKPF